jgi:plastocyanin
MKTRLPRSVKVLLASTFVSLAASAVAASLQPVVREIAQHAIRFSQPNLIVKAGDIIKYKNDDDVTHNLMVIGADDMPLDQGLQPPGAVVTHKFGQAGTFEVRCAIHPKMKMNVTVMP